MNGSDYVLARLRALPAYKPGITEERLRRETGLGQIFKFASNETPLPPSPAVAAAMCEALHQSNRYPDAQALLDQLAQRLAVPADRLMLGNGSIDVIAAMVRACVGPEHNVVLSQFGYCAYPAFVKEQGAGIRIASSGRHFGHDVDQLLGRVDAHTRMVLVDSPTNLSGCPLGTTALQRLIRELPPQVLLLLDEAYAEFVEGDAPYTEKLAARHPNVIVTRTFSKAYGLAGLRIGYAIADAGLVEAVSRIRLPFSVSRVALAGALAALDDTAHVERIVRSARHGRRQLAGALQALGITVVEGCANFVLADFGTAAAQVYQGLLARGFITRSMQAYGLPKNIRISVGTSAEIERLSAAIGPLWRSAAASPRTSSAEHA